MIRLRLPTFPILLIGTLIYMLVLHLSYVHEIAPFFSYIGFVYHPASVKVIIEAWIWAALPVVFLPVQLSRPSQVVCWILYLLVYIPAQIFPYYTLEMPEFKLAQLSLVLFFAFMIIVSVRFIPVVRIRRLTVSSGSFSLILLFFSLVAYSYIIISFGLRLSIPNVANVYDVRLEYREQIANKGPFLAYFILWQGNIVNNLVIAKGIAMRRLSYAAAGFLGQLIIFSIAGYKSMFFSSLMVVGVMLAMRHGGKRFGIYALGGGIALILSTMLMDRLFSTIVYMSLFVRRVIVTPGLVTGFYYEFFSQHEKAHMAQSILAPFFTYPYDISYNFLIGYYYYGRADVSMNANLLADGYANFGFFGIILAATVLGCLLWLVDSLSCDRDQRVTNMVIGIVAFSLSNSALPTVLLSHGFAFLLLLLAIMPRSFLQASEPRLSDAAAVMARGARPAITSLAVEQSDWPGGH